MLEVCHLPLLIHIQIMPRLDEDMEVAVSPLKLAECQQVYFGLELLTAAAWDNSMPQSILTFVQSYQQT